MSARVFVGVGSNVAPEPNVARALERLEGSAGLVAISTFFATPALERPADPAFVNGVVEVGDALAPEELQALLQRIEQEAGRRRSGDRFAPRELDLDLLLYDDLVSKAPGLSLPHHDVTVRRFVAQPLLELAPELVVPGLDLRLAVVAQSLPPYPMEPLLELTQELRRRFLGHRGRRG